jgi:hypothetical protein
MDAIEMLYEYPEWLKRFEMTFSGRCSWIQGWTFGSITLFSLTEIQQLPWDQLSPITSSHHVNFNYYWNSLKLFNPFSLNISIFMVKRLNRLCDEAFKISRLHVTEYHIPILAFTNNDWKFST